MADLASQEDTLIRKVFAVALTAEQMPATQAPAEPVLLMDGLATELLSDHMGEANALLLNKDSLDRLVVARLIENAPETYPQSPLQYLMRCYARAGEEARARGTAAAPELSSAIQACRELIINYAALTLGGGIIPHIGAVAAAAEARGALQLLDSIDKVVGQRGAPESAVALPPGFLEDLAAKYQADNNQEGLQEVLGPVVKELARRIKGCTVLGDYAPSLAGVRLLVGIEPAARALVAMREFLPNLKDITGRGIESPGSSWLGPCFCPSAVDDGVLKAQPNVGEQCFSGVDSRRAGDVQQAMRTLQLASKQLRGELNAIVKLLLNKTTRPAMIDWLAATIEGNAERGKMQWNEERGASHGFFLNHNAVMLALAAPFMESPNFWKRVDVRYVAHNPRLDFSEDTKLGASSSEDKAWRERVASSAGASSSSSANGSATPGGGIEYHFICECFFMTLKSLRFGLVKMLDDLSVVQQDLGHIQRSVQQLELEADRLTGTPMSAAVNHQLRRIKGQFQSMQASMYEYSAVLQDEGFMGEVLAFYRLVACWLLSVADPTSNGAMGLGMGKRLPETPPVEFVCLPEWFLEDIVDVLTVVSRNFPPLLMNTKVDEIMMLMLAMMDQPKYVRSSHMRAKMAELLHLWLPQDDVQQQPGARRRYAPRGKVASTVTQLFQGHPVVCERLVPSLVRLYADVEVMDVRNNFYEKFMYRQYIGEILQHLWELPAHRESWKRFAREEGTGSLGYVRFTNMLITDATYLLDESLKKVEEIRTAQQKMSDPAEMAALSARERHELQSSHDQAAGILRALLGYAQVTVEVMNFSTEEVANTFLLPEMVGRTATMLNYFMSLLTGPQRKKLALKEPEKFNFRPRELLLNLLSVYLHLSEADRSGAFYKAVAGDARSYTPSMFAEAARVLSSAQMLSPVDAARLDALDMGVQRAAAEAAEHDDLLQGVEVPEEFQDPVMNEVMTDPVLLPTSNSIMDRSTITRHLLTDQRDPMSRAPLTPDMLIPQPELKARIQAWMKETRAAQQAARRLA